MDPLSDVLKSVQLEGAVYLNAEFSAPWALRGCYGMASVRQRLAGADHVVFFHYLIEGRAKIRLDDDTPALDVQGGDLVLLPRDDRHLMGSDLHVAPLETENLNSDNPRLAQVPADMIQIRHGGGGEVTRFVCGYLACHRNMVRPVLDALPRLLRVPMGDGAPARSLHELLRLGINESNDLRPGSTSTLAKLSELMFVEALRRYAASVPPDARGLLAALRDAQVGRALALMHEDPARPWTVNELALRVAMSRSALAERFAELVGEPPMQYLTRWRLALAARALRAGDLAIVRVAEQIGYESEAAFTRAFKREFGLPPAAWRRAAAAPT